MLGTPLFDRIGRSVRLTEAGVVFRRHADPGLAGGRDRAGGGGRPPGAPPGDLALVGVTHWFCTAS